MKQNNLCLAWLRGPYGSPTDYFHSEGVCCSYDTVEGVPGAHKACKVDVEYTFRRALQQARQTEFVPHIKTLDDLTEAYEYFTRRFPGDNLHKSYVQYFENWQRLRWK